MDKLKMHSPDMTQDNIAKIRTLFPGCVSEAASADGSIGLAVDFDQLRQELSDSIVEGPQERYQLNWPGKREAMVIANAPIAKTFRPSLSESVNFDQTKNLFIEGDNLEALKLLQETYLGMVKMIYIDPPYNTGNDFVYDDDFAESTSEFLAKSNQVDAAGNRLLANTAANGRFHSDWLSMMYARLKIAKSLLSDNGVIFVSIGDAEVGNLRILMNEVFGPDNFEGHIHWRRRHNQPNDKTKMIGVVAEHILAFAKDKEAFKQDGVGKLELTATFSNPDDDPNGPWASKPWRVGSDQSGSKYTIVTPTGLKHHGEWMGEESTFKKHLADGRMYFPDRGNGSPRKKYYQHEREEEGQCATNWWPHEQFGHNQEGNTTLAELFDGIKNVFSNPKPPRLLAGLMAIANVRANDLVLDFFLGSASTYHATKLLDVPVRFVGIQIAEELKSNVAEHIPALNFCVENGLAADFASISKTRMRRVDFLPTSLGKNLGFRVLKIDTSNMADVYYTPDATNQGDLLANVDSIKQGRTADDLLFQVLVDWGVDLTLPIRRETVQGKTVFFVDENALVACFDTGVTEELVKELAGHEPVRVVFRDTGFVSDAVKINVEQIFRQLSPSTEVKAI
jgi:adenine-specific DNA-methyltransferase